MANRAVHANQLEHLEAKTAAQAVYLLYILQKGFLIPQKMHLFVFELLLKPKTLLICKTLGQLFQLLKIFSSACVLAANG